MQDHTSRDERIAQLTQRVVAQDAQIQALKDEVIRLRRWKFGRSSEVIDVTVMPELPLHGGQITEPAPLPTQPLTASVSRLESVDKPGCPGATAPGARPTRTPRALPPELPRVIRIHSPHACNCAQCGAALKRLGEDVSEQLDYVPGYFQVIRHIRPKLVCSPCARIVQVGAPSRPIARSLPTPALLAQVIAAKYADHCPLYRQEGIYRRSGVELPRATLADWMSQTARLLDPLVLALERYVMSARKLHADDTPVPVLEPGKGRTRTGRLWAYVRDERPAAGPDPPAVLYRYTPDRRSEHPQAHLLHFCGTLQADGYAGFNALYERDRQPLIQAACWAHARRKYYDVYKAEGSATALATIGRIGELYAIERAIRGQTPKYRQQVRQQQAGPKLADLQEWLRGQLRALSVKSPLAAAIQYTLVRWRALTHYIADGAIEIDNNAAERAIRALVLGRRNYLFAGSDGGGHTAARLYSLIGTCRLNGIDPHRYLNQVLECVAEHPINRIEELLPWRIGSSLPNARQAA